ncbi:MAG: MerR family transcriptional regulator [Lachnospiraceae bacterium]|nr:MerR family transcriptional regulator [Lachnospiraceae bacterium]
MNKYYTIGQLAKLAGISTKTLRVYERKGLLLPERNEENGYRMYGEESVKTMEKIQLMKYLDFSLDQIAAFLRLYENVSRKNMLLEQKRLLEKKREQLNTVIAHVDRTVQECEGEELDDNTFLKALGRIVRDRRADELVLRLKQHADEPRGWSRFIFDMAELQTDMRVLDAGAGIGNLWRYNRERLPKKMNVTCVDRHNTHMDTFYADAGVGELKEYLQNSDFYFVWDDLETMSLNGPYERIFFNHVVSHITNRHALYRKFDSALSGNGVFICTWGGLLFYEKLLPLLYEFFEEKEYTELDELYHKHKAHVEDWEKELHAVFPKVERHAYVLTLHFGTAEEFLEYIQQVCRPVRESLETRRKEFLEFLVRFKNEDGEFIFERDTYLYCCRKN